MLNPSEYFLHNDDRIVEHIESRQLSTVPHEGEPIFDMVARSLIFQAIRGFGFLECNTVGYDAWHGWESLFDRIEAIGT